MGCDNIKKVVITKNGFDVLKIIEMNSDKQNCAFKIVPLIDLTKLKITTMKMFSLCENIEFDSSKTVEITYHKSDYIHDTKIHIKMIDKQNNENVTYKTLPLNRLIDPNVNTEIPIPLLKITIPNDVLINRHESNNRYVEFDMEENNLLEIFMTRKDFINENFIEKFPEAFDVLTGDSFEFFTSGVFRGYNLDCTLNESFVKNEPKNFMVGANITNDIGMMLLKIFDLKINSLFANFLFIENEFYLPICVYRLSGRSINRQNVYESDLENNKTITEEEKKKIKYRIEKQIKKFVRYSKSHRNEQEFIINYLENQDN